MDGLAEGLHQDVLRGEEASDAAQVSAVGERGAAQVLPIDGRSDRDPARRRCASSRPSSISRSRRRMSAWALSCSSSATRRRRTGASKKSRSRSTCTPSSPVRRAPGSRTPRYSTSSRTRSERHASTSGPAHAVDLPDGGVEVGLGVAVVALLGRVADLPHRLHDPAHEPAEPLDARPQASQRDEEGAAAREVALVGPVQVEDALLVRALVQRVRPEDAPEEAAPVGAQALEDGGAEAHRHLVVAPRIVVEHVQGGERRGHVLGVPALGGGAGLAAVLVEARSRATPRSRARASSSSAPISARGMAWRL